jgi:mannan endo-1,6-alpha-mannosidase
MAVLEIIQSNLVDSAPGWVSAIKGTGTSEGDVNAGSLSSSTADDLIVTPITRGDRVGAGFLTALIMIGVVGGSATLVI